MVAIVIPFAFLWITVACTSDEYYYYPHNVSRSTLSAIAAYRSSLTLDWLEAEDMRQRELAAAFETEAAPPARFLSTDCISYSRPASGKVARLMLELLKNLEGDDGTLVNELIQSLIRSKLLVETSMLEAEPDLDALVKTPAVMMGEPHTTFPRILALVWLTLTDPSTTKKTGWCSINNINKYLSVNRPVSIAKHMRAIEPIVARARFIMEEFIQNVTPLNMYEKKHREFTKEKPHGRHHKVEKHPASRDPASDLAHQLPTSTAMIMLEDEPHVHRKHVVVNCNARVSICKFLLLVITFNL